MKKIVKIVVGLVFLIVLGALISSFSTNTVSNENNGVNVEIIELDGMIFVQTVCGDEEPYEIYPIEVQSGKAQLKNGSLHVWHWVGQLPLDNCMVPSEEEGAQKYSIYGGKLIINPSGKVVFKKIVNPLKKE